MINTMDVVSSLRAVCGSESRLRLLRALFQTPQPRHLRALAQAAGVDPARVHRLLPELVETGICERIDARPHAAYRASPGHPFYSALTALFGSDPAGSSAGSVSPVKRFEDRSLALHAAAVRILRADPGALARARVTLDRWIARHAGSPPQALVEWSAILSQSRERVAAIALELSERGDRLRKSSPLSTLVGKEERRRIYAAH